MVIPGFIKSRTFFRFRRNKAMRIGLLKYLLIYGFLFITLMIGLPAIAGDDLDLSNSIAPEHPAPPPPNSPTWQTNVDNGDGTWTFTQQVDEASTPPNYLGPWYSPSYCGFEIYSWYDGNYGWQHSFVNWNMPSLNIISAKLTIVAWDVDSEPSWGWYGEYDGIHVDGNLLSPGYLQGFNGTWSTTVFDLPVEDIVDDGIIDVWMDIDMHHDYDNWATTLDYSRIEIRYSDFPNDPPYQPELAYGINLGVDCVTGAQCSQFGQDLVIDVVGPTPVDPDDDAVTYTYRWFVDIGTGGFIDDEFAGRGNHTGNIVPAADIHEGDVWQVQVIPVDEHGAIGQMTTVAFPAFCPSQCPNGGICVNSSIGIVGVEGVQIVLTDEYGNYVTDGYTDNMGNLAFDDLTNGNYLIEAIVPMGFAVNPAGPQPVMVNGYPCTEVAFQLTPTATGKVKNIWWWKTQLLYIAAGQPAAVSMANINKFGQVIYNHYYLRGDGNAIQIENVTYAPGPEPLDFYDLYDIFITSSADQSTKACAARALLTNFLNIAAGYQGQLAAVSEDGATASQAMIYFSGLYLLGGEANYYSIHINLRKMHMGQLIAAGVIPLATPNIIFKPEDMAMIPADFNLSRNYPNPFNPFTTIELVLPSASSWNLEIFNVSGQKMAEYSGRAEAGIISVVWDASDMASGIYFYKATTKDFSVTRKMVLLK
jgi:hypothetical protein